MSRGIAFTQYHRGENQSGYPDGIIREVWSSDWQDTFQAVGLSNTVQRVLYENRTSMNWSGAQFPEWPGIADELVDVMVWFVDDEEKAFGNFCLWLSRVVNEASSVGGDDSYFDYYPDQFHIADQIARAMTPRWEKAVQEAKDKVYSLGLYHDEDCINHGHGVEE